MGGGLQSLIAGGGPATGVRGGGLTPDIMPSATPAPWPSPAMPPLPPPRPQVGDFNPQPALNYGMNTPQQNAMDLAFGQSVIDPFTGSPVPAPSATGNAKPTGPTPQGMAAATAELAKRPVQGAQPQLAGSEGWTNLAGGTGSDTVGYDPSKDWRFGGKGDPWENDLPAPPLPPAAPGRAPQMPSTPMGLPTDKFTPFGEIPLTDRFFLPPGSQVPSESPIPPVTEFLDIDPQGRGRISKPVQGNQMIRRPPDVPRPGIDTLLPPPREDIAGPKEPEDDMAPYRHGYKYDPGKNLIITEPEPRPQSPTEPKGEFPSQKWQGDVQGQDNGLWLDPNVYDRDMMRGMRKGGMQRDQQGRPIGQRAGVDDQGRVQVASLDPTEAFRLGVQAGQRSPEGVQVVRNDNTAPQGYDAWSIFSEQQARGPGAAFQHRLNTEKNIMSPFDIWDQQDRGGPGPPANRNIAPPPLKPVSQLDDSSIDRAHDWRDFDYSTPVIDPNGEIRLQGTRSNMPRVDPDVQPRPWLEPRPQLAMADMGGASITDAQPGVGTAKAEVKDEGGKSVGQKVMEYFNPLTQTIDKVIKTPLPSGEMPEVPQSQQLVDYLRTVPQGTATDTSGELTPAFDPSGKPLPGAPLPWNLAISEMLPESGNAPSWMPTARSVWDKLTGVPERQGPPMPQLPGTATAGATPGTAEVKPPVRYGLPGEGGLGPARQVPTQQMTITIDKDGQVHYGTKPNPLATPATPPAAAPPAATLPPPDYRTDLGPDLRIPAAAQAQGQQRFVDYLYKKESGGTRNPDFVRNPRSTATGRAQFTEGTWLETVDAAMPHMAGKMSRQDKLALRNDPHWTNAMTLYHAKYNVGKLEEAGIEPTDMRVFAMHRLGADGAIRVMKNPDKPIASVLGQDVVNKNPDLRQTGRSWLASLETEYDDFVTGSTSPTSIADDPAVQGTAKREVLAQAAQRPVPDADREVTPGGTVLPKRTPQRADEPPLKLPDAKKDTKKYEEAVRGLTPGQVVRMTDSERRFKRLAGLFGGMANGRSWGDMFMNGAAGGLRARASEATEDRAAAQAEIDRDFQYRQRLATLEGELATADQQNRQTDVSAANVNAERAYEVQKFNQGQETATENQREVDRAAAINAEKEAAKPKIGVTEKGITVQKYDPATGETKIEHTPLGQVEKDFERAKGISELLGKDDWATRRQGYEEVAKKYGSDGVKLQILGDLSQNSRYVQMFGANKTLVDRLKKIAEEANKALAPAAQMDPKVSEKTQSEAVKNELIRLWQSGTLQEEWIGDLARQGHPGALLLQPMQ